MNEDEHYNAKHEKNNVDNVSNLIVDQNILEKILIELQNSMKIMYKLRLNEVWQKLCQQPKLS